MKTTLLFFVAVTASVLFLQVDAQNETEGPEDKPAATNIMDLTKTILQSIKEALLQQVPDVAVQINNILKTVIHILFKSIRM